MKKTIAVILGTVAMMSQAYAETGCKALANTKWSGQVKLVSGKIVKITRIVINRVDDSGSMFKLIGNMEGEAITGMFGCTENKAGSIGMVNLDSATSSLMIMEFAPNNQNPTGMKRLGGRWKGAFIDTTSEPAKNFLKKG